MSERANALTYEQNGVLYRTPVLEDAESMRTLRGEHWMEYVDDDPRLMAWMQGRVQAICGTEGVEVEAGRIESHLTDPDSNYWFRVAEVEDEFAGYIAGYRVAEAFSDHQEVASLQIEKKFRGAGIGSTLLGLYFVEMGQQRPTVLDVVARAEKSVKFYMRHGFNTWHEQTDQWGDLEVLRMRRKEARYEV